VFDTAKADDPLVLVTTGAALADDADAHTGTHRPKRPKAIARFIIFLFLEKSSVLPFQSSEVNRRQHQGQSFFFIFCLGEFPDKSVRIVDALQ
jgi:hypothetical protein